MLHADAYQLRCKGTDKKELSSVLRLRGPWAALAGCGAGCSCEAREGLGKCVLAFNTLTSGAELSVILRRPDYQL